MKISSPLSRALLRGLLVTTLAVAAGACGASEDPAPSEAGDEPSTAHPKDPPPAGQPSDPGSAPTAPPAPEPRPTYLALGDSIAFGYNLNHQTFLADGTSKNLPDQAAHAVGYPEALAKILERDSKVRVRVANTACPGEAAGSLVTGAHVDDNNCWENRHEFALHYEYAHADYDHRDGSKTNVENYGSATSQLDHALAFLGDDPNHVKLVTITAGANDALRFAGAACNWAEALGDKGCLAAGAFDAVMNKVQGHWETILAALATSGYRGPVVAVLYYSTGYKLTDLPVRAGIKLLNAKIHDAAKNVLARYPLLNLKFVESYDVFSAASSSSDGDACKAGLLMLMTAGPRKGTCDAHPSNFGEELLAANVWKSLSATEQQALLASGASSASAP